MERTPVNRVQRYPFNLRNAAENHWKFESVNFATFPELNI